MAGILTFDQGATLYLIFKTVKKIFHTKVTKMDRKKSNLSETHKKIKKGFSNTMSQKKFTT